MTALFSVLLVLACLAISLLAVTVLSLLTRNADLERQVEEAELAAAECVRATSEARQEYTKILWLHDGDTVGMLQQAWRAALNK